MFSHGALESSLRTDVSSFGRYPVAEVDTTTPPEPGLPHVTIKATGESGEIVDSDGAYKAWQDSDGKSGEQTNHLAISTALAIPQDPPAMPPKASEADLSVDSLHESIEKADNMTPSAQCDPTDTTQIPMETTPQNPFIAGENSSAALNPGDQANEDDSLNEGNRSTIVMIKEGTEQADTGFTPSVCGVSETDGVNETDAASEPDDETGDLNSGFEPWMLENGDKNSDRDDSVSLTSASEIHSLSHKEDRTWPSRAQYFGETDSDSRTGSVDALLPKISHHDSPIQMSWGASLLQLITQFATAFSVGTSTEIHVGDTRRRVQWRCTCDETFHQDFIADDQDLADSLYKALSTAGYATSLLQITQLDGGSKGPGLVTMNSENKNANNAYDPSSASKEHTPAEASNSDPSTGAQSTDDPDRLAASPKWLLLCFDHYKTVGKHKHVPIADALDDIALVSKLKKTYLSSRSITLRLLSWTDIRAIAFTKFQVRLDGKIDGGVVIRCSDWKPPKHWKRDKEWQPRPIGKKPTLPSTFLLHLWNHPHDTAYFRAKRASISACKRAGDQIIAKVKPLRRTLSRLWSLPILPVSRSLNAETTSPAGNEHPIQLTQVLASCGPSTSKPGAILACSPIKLQTPLEASLEDSPYGWGIYLEEGFAVPESIRAFALFLMFALIFGVMVYCASSVAKYGMDVFSLWEDTIALCALLAMVLFRYADSRA